jgi:hypothetical protein
LNGLHERGETVETVGPLTITARCHRAEATVLMRSLRAVPIGLFVQGSQRLGLPNC